MSERFYNPYQFIPVNTRALKETQLTVYKEQVREGQGKSAKKNETPHERQSLDRADNYFVRHDYWHKDGLSGRIRCSLRVVSPLVVGATQTSGIKARGKTEGISGKVELYQIPSHTAKANNIVEKQYAIPGNSLRGMVGSVTEMISQSSLRVLHNLSEGDYSVRKAVGDPLKKLGLLLKEGEAYFIYPLADTMQPVNLKKLRSNVELIRSNDTYQHIHNNKLVDHNGQQGILYIRGKVSDDSNKQNEFFIRWNGKPNPKQRLLVPEAIVKSFDQVLKARLAEYQKSQKKEAEDTECKLWPKGYNNNAERAKKDIESCDISLLRSGDVLYYDASTEVTELSYSAIWRKVVKGDIFQSFKNAAGDNAVPWNPCRTHLTPAEALFGVVEDNPDKEKGARNLASRIRFSDAISDSVVELAPEVTLKILNSPKPLSPAMYFSANGKYDKEGRQDVLGRYIAKADLDLTEHAPNGRKYYIPHTKGAEDWKHDPKMDQDRDHMRLSCQPIKAGACFQFDIHFENLSDKELGLLRTALQPAGLDQPFIHRLGLGKPYGLGEVSIDQAEVSLIDRQRRYTPARFTQDSTYQSGKYKALPDSSLIEKEPLQTLLAMADSNKYQDFPVCYPYDQASNKEPHQSPHNEENGYQWFVENDKGRKDFLHFDSGRLGTSKPDRIMKPLSSSKRRNTD